MKAGNFSVVGAIAVAGAVLLGGLQCKDSSVTPQPPKTLQLLAPTGGANLKVGDSVIVKWKINDINAVSSVVVLLAKNGDADEFTLGNGSFTYPDTSCLWVVAATDTGKNCFIKIKDYFPGNDFSDQSKTFDITLQ